MGLDGAQDGAEEQEQGDPDQRGGGQGGHHQVGVEALPVGVDQTADAGLPRSAGGRSRCRSLQVGVHGLATDAELLGQR